MNQILPAIMPNDRKAFNKIAQNNKAAFQFIFECYKKRLFFAMNKLAVTNYLSKEKVQDIFIALRIKCLNVCNT